MKKTIWLDRGDCLAIHEMMLAQHGGLAGVRDEGLLEFTLAKPRNLSIYRSATLPELAASYAAGIIVKHPFLDGNKRTGFMLTAVFMELNGLILTASEEAVVEKTLAMASGKLKEAGYADWLTDNTKKI